MHHATGGGLADVYGNHLAAINGTRNTSVAVTIVADATAPLLVGFDLEASGSRNVTLRFDEPVDPHSLDGTAWYLQRAATSTYGYVALNGLASAAAATRTVIAGVSAATRATLADALLGTTLSNSYLRPVASLNPVDTWASIAVADVAGNFIHAVADGAAVALGPRVLSFVLDMDDRTLELRLSEAVSATTFDATGLSLQEAEAHVVGAESLTLASTTAIVFAEGSCEPHAILALTNSDVETLRYMARLTRGNRSTYLAVGAGTAVDMDGDNAIGANAMNAIAPSSALRAAAVYADATPPSVVSCALDLDASELILIFDEPVRASSFDPRRVDLRSGRDAANATASVVLTAESVAAADDYALVVVLSGRDTSAIKASAPLGRSRNTTYCFVRSAAVDDLGAGGAFSSGNANRARVVRARKVTLDATPPKLAAFTLDLDTNALVLVFDEPVNTSTVRPVERSVLLSSVRSASAPSLRLRCSTAAIHGDHYNETVRVALCRDDIDALMAVAGLCRATTSCYLSHAYDLAKDTTTPPNVAASLAVEYGLEASAILADVTPPAVASFALDLDAGTLTLAFDEVVDLRTIDVDTLTFQSARFNDGIGTRTLSRDNGTEVAFDASGANMNVNTNATTVVVALGRDDLDAVKALGGVGLALDADSTYLSHASGLVSDVFGNGAARVWDYAAAGPAANWTADATPPRLLAVSKVSSTKKILYALFDEPVDHATANLSAIALSRSDAGDLLYLDDADLGVEVLDPAEDDDAGTLADYRAPYSTTLALRLGDAYEMLPVASQTATYLSLAVAAIRDVALGHPNLLEGDSADASAYPGTGGARATRLGPAVEAFALNMDAPATLTLQFTDRVVANGSALDAMAVTLQAAYARTQGGTATMPAVQLGADSTAYAAAELGRADARLKASQLLAASEVALSEGGDRVIRIRLSSADTWQLQRAAAGLGKASGATWAAIGTGFAHTDDDSSLVGDPMEVCERAEDRALALAPTTFAGDATAPSLTNYTLDLDAGLLELFFDEPIAYRDLNLSSISLKNAQEPPYLSVSLSDASAVVNSDPRGAYAACDDAAGNRSEYCDYVRVNLGKRDYDSVRAAQAGNWIDMAPDVAADAAGNRANALASTASIHVGACAPAPESACASSRDSSGIPIFGRAIVSRRVFEEIESTWLS